MRRPNKNKPAKKSNNQPHKTITQTLPDETSDFFSTRARWFLLGLIILFVIVIRIRLLEIPFERDEGEYAYMGQLLLQGVAPYSEAYNMKLPGTSLMYAGIMALFGQSIQSTHLGLMILNCVTVLLVFYLGRKLVNDFMGIIASGTYALLSLSSSVLGFAAHATHFVVLPAIGGTILLLYSIEKNKPHLYFLSGIVFGLAFIMKQPGFFFSLFGASYLLYQYWSSKPRQLLITFVVIFSSFLSGALLPCLIVMIWIYSSGTFDTFWFWTVQYASQYASQIPLSEAFGIFKENFFSVADGFFILWIIAALGFFVVLLHRNSKVDRVFILLFAVFSFLTVCPGFYFREHYFITLLPAISLAVGIFINYLVTKSISFLKPTTAKLAGLGFFIVASLIGIITQKEYLFKDDPVNIATKIYGANPFPESIEIAKFIEAKSKKTDKIAVLGSEPQIYFYSKRRSATGYIYTYSLMENHDYSLTMQKDMIREIESSKPKFIIVVRVATSWLARPHSNKYIFDWINNYLPRNYRLVGVADILPSTTVYRWDADSKKYGIQGQNYVLIFEKEVILPRQEPGVS